MAEERECLVEKKDCVCAEQLTFGELCRRIVEIGLEELAKDRGRESK